MKIILFPEVWAVTLAGTFAFCLAASVLSFRQVAGLDPAMVFRG